MIHSGIGSRDRGRREYREYMRRNRDPRVVIWIAGGLAVIALVISVIVIFLHRRGENIIIRMPEATLPAISFVIEGREANLLTGHKREMNIAAVRDAVTTYGENKTLDIRLRHMEGIDSVKYGIYTQNGVTKLKEETLSGKTVKDEAGKSAGEKMTIPVGDALKEGQEGILKITIRKDEDDIFYYTRILQGSGYHVKECLEFIEGLHLDLINKQNEDAIKKVMEPNAGEGNSSLGHVTIHSDLRRVTWGNLKPAVTGDTRLEIKEVRKTYISARLRYEVQCDGESGSKEKYDVNEFFKVSYGAKGMYLLSYDRTMDEIFTPSDIALSSNGILLGIADKDIPCLSNMKATAVAFVQAGELWHYSKKDNTFSLVFTFADPDRKDARSLTDLHSIKILSMDDDGNMTFSVCGYMNRGEHEGESGLSVYSYDMKKDAVREEIFIPSAEALPVIGKNISDMAYFNKDRDLLYVILGNKLVCVNTKKNEADELMDGLEKGEYVTSSGGRMLAIKKQEGNGTFIEIRNFEKEKKQEIRAAAGEKVVPVGFVGSDFVYGICKDENKEDADAGTSIAASTGSGPGDGTVAMERLEIRNEKGKVVKTYRKDNTYILHASIEDGMVKLQLGVKNGDGYSDSGEDYITSSEPAVYESVALSPYSTDLKETQYRISFPVGNKNKNPDVRVSGQAVPKEKPEFAAYESDKTDYYYVYGEGRQAGAFTEPGDAIALADDISGVVISPKQNYIWEDDNQRSWYRNFDVPPCIAGEGESTLEACLRTVLSYEGKKADPVSKLSGASPGTVLGKNLDTEIIRFRGCSVRDMFYLIDKGVPVIALCDASRAVLLVGYDAATVTYIDPASGDAYISRIENADAMLAGNGHAFIGYVR